MNSCSRTYETNTTRTIALPTRASFDEGRSHFESKKILRMSGHGRGGGAKSIVRKTCV
jgi:hypothetical protein